MYIYKVQVNVINNWEELSKEMGRFGQVGVRRNERNEEMNVRLVTR